MNDEKKISLNIREVMVLKEWFQVVCYHSQIEQRDKSLVERFIEFEKECIKLNKK